VPSLTTPVHSLPTIPGVDPYYSDDQVALYHGEVLDLLTKMVEPCFDAVVTDPPYSSGGTHAPSRTTRTPQEKYVQSGQKKQRPGFAGDNRDQRSWITWCSVWLAQALRLSRPGSPILVFSDWRQLPALTDAVQAGGWTWRGIVQWDKTTASRPQRGRFRAQCEYVAWGSAGAMPLERAAPCLPGVFQARVTQDDKHHITGKPTELMRELLGVVEPGGVVLDPFAGSGTTLVAARSLGLKVVGFEMDEGYCEVTAGRLRRS